jgi:cytochrome c oxidase subunit II
VKPGEDRMPKQTHGHTALEISWTIVPALILAVMAVFTITDIFSLAKQPSGPGTLKVTVSARQWWWQFTYEDGTNIITANELHMPVNTPVALTLVGPPLCTEKNCYNNGVIHSFWVPALNGKKDVVPGRQQYLKLFASRTGTFRGPCAEYCGLSHADMRLRAVVQTADDFKAWEASQLNAKPTADLLTGVDAGTWKCQSCHSFTPKVAGAVAPNLSKLADRQAFAGDIYDMTWSNLWQWVYNAPGRKPMGNLTLHMPAFNGQGMSQDEAKKIACFLLENTATNPQPLPKDECPT